MQLPRDVAGYRRYVFPLKSYQACGAVKLGKVELNSTFPEPGTSCHRVIPDAATECLH